jgi:L-alanine-DL-glutamate epimerase-like enolase superfamily enzyme
MMTRRKLLGIFAGGSLLAKAHAALKKIKITRIRYWESPISRPIFNQSFHIVTVETDQGITGIGEGGSKDTIEQCAAMLIGQEANRIEHLWQYMYRGYFYPPGREKIHALGALDMALWDIKGKALGVPVYELLGGLTRNYVECYSTGFPRQGSVRETARACIEFGFRAFRTSVTGPGDGEVFDARRQVEATYEHCREIREGVGKNGDWAIDYHTRLDFADAIRLSQLLEPLNPLFCEDLVRSEYQGLYEKLRLHVKVPIAVGEHHSDRWDIRTLIENDLIDYCRVTLPNSGGITDLVKLAALCETHYIGLVPHFTGPIAEAALVHVCASFPGPAIMEMTGDGTREIPYLPRAYDFRRGKMYPVETPGLGVEFDSSKTRMLAEITEFRQPIPLYRRPDGSITNW